MTNVLFFSNRFTSGGIAPFVIAGYLLQRKTLMHLHHELR